MFVTESVEMKMSPHKETRSFIVAPSMDSTEFGMAAEVEPLHKLEEANVQESTERS